MLRHDYDIDADADVMSRMLTLSDFRIRYFHAAPRDVTCMRYAAPFEAQRYALLTMRDGATLYAPYERRGARFDAAPGLCDASAC